MSVFESNYFTLAQIDRAFFEVLRLKLVSLGYLPNKLLLSNIDYENEKKNLQNNNNLVDLYGVGGYEVKEQIKYSTIIIERINEKYGDISNSDDIIFDRQTDGSFKTYFLPRSMSNLSYQIRIICKDIKKERILDSIVRSVILTKGYFMGVNEDRTTTQNLFAYQRQGNINLSLSPPYIEKIYPLEVVNVFIDNREFKENISAMIEPKIEIYTPLL